MPAKRNLSAGSMCGMKVFSCQRLFDFVAHPQSKVAGCWAGRPAFGAELSVAGNFLRVGCIHFEHGDSPWVSDGKMRSSESIDPRTLFIPRYRGELRWVGINTVL